jgi:hypothetical protein
MVEAGLFGQKKPEKEAGEISVLTRAVAPSILGIGGAEKIFSKYCLAWWKKGLMTCGTFFGVRGAGVAAWFSPSH